jgi:hypothetical protein
MVMHVCFSFLIDCFIDIEKLNSHIVELWKKEKKKSYKIEKKGNAKKQTGSQLNCNFLLFASPFFSHYKSWHADIMNQ